MNEKNDVNDLEKNKDPDVKTTFNFFDNLKAFRRSRKLVVLVVFIALFFNSVLLTTLSNVLDLSI
jgi:hypothetical protein